MLPLPSLIATYLPPLLHYPVKLCMSTSGFVYVASILTSNVSQVDRLWTFLPTIYTAYYALLPLWPREHSVQWLEWIVPYVPRVVEPALTEQFNQRALMILALVVTWMFRLSYNTWRRGLFKLQDEDYRWAVLRSQLHPVLFQLTNLTFISFIQNVILFLLGLPTYFVVINHDPFPLYTDIAVVAVCLTILSLEFTSDNQQYAYHAWKHAIQIRNADSKTYQKYDASQHWPGSRLDWSEEDAKLGFLKRGLWAYSRHPNFTCEQSFWWVITLTPLLALTIAEWDALTMTSLAIYLSPALVLSTLFFSSTLYTENITSSKYPQYKKYQDEVPMFGPFGATKGPARWLWRRYMQKKKD